MSTPTPIPHVQATAPARIYLVIGEDVEPDTDFDDLERGMYGVTWCADKIDDNSIPYVRADLASLPAPQGEQQSDEQIIRAAVAAMPHTNPGVADDLIQGFTMHTEAEDIVAIWRAAQGASQDARTSSVAPGGQPLPQPNSQDGDSVLPPVEPSGATLSPCAASQWISVSERLPPLNTEVLIAFDTSPLPATGQLTMYRGIRQWCWPAENDPVGDESLLAVTHWAFIRHPSEIGEWAAQVDRGESSSEGGESNG